MTEAIPDQTRRDPEAEPAMTTDGDDIKSKRVTLADLSAKGTALYAQKSYEAAADIFSTASTLQASINGETAPENAEILFHYGRSLFRVGQSKSDVLGGPATAAAAAVDAAVGSDSKKPKQAAGDDAKEPADDAKPAESETAKKEEPSVKDNATIKDAVPDAKKPLFQFTGDDNFDQDDDDEDDDQEVEDEANEAEDDELAMAFEILDLARVCYLKQLEQLEKEHPPGKGKDAAPAEDPPSVRHVKERLADTHDCLAEISLENERYPDAIEDGRVSLKYKMDLYPEESEVIAEAHYKLSLALEFASVTTPAPEEDESKSTSKDQNNTANKPAAMDTALRNESIHEMELAIKSFRLKMQTEEVELATMASPEDNDAARKAIAEMKDIVADMETRLVDLRKGPVDADALIASAMSSKQPSKPSDEARQKATDLTALVRKKTRGADEGKRKAEEEPAGAENGSTSPKKARIEEGDAAAAVAS
ncbi:histone H1-binding protein [Ophiocordyceps camponoti-floridani]|uniref:Histone H1-binding protein n=1 Tax=Ophiocordyceps camponoti-floridani TaxID=2030778 RepID=A0A8H4QDC1_9HYPO|nr:histone H1-binding protein [Ophiocordyceps camponoti-floridani]